MFAKFAIIGAVLAIALVGGAAFGLLGKPMSLAADLGYEETDVCAALDAYGAQAVARLEASGFPHASTSSVETYRLVHEGAVEAAVRIDWASGAASCVEDASRATATLSMTSAAYDVLVIELTNVITTGDMSGGLGNMIAMWWGSDVTVHGNEAYGPVYEREVARWAAARLVDGGP